MDKNEKVRFLVATKLWNLKKCVSNWYDLIFSAFTYCLRPWSFFFKLEFYRNYFAKIFVTSQTSILAFLIKKLVYQRSYLESLHCRSNYLTWSLCCEEICLIVKLFASALTGATLPLLSVLEQNKWTFPSCHRFFKHCINIMQTKCMSKNITPTSKFFQEPMYFTIYNDTMMRFS